MVYRSTFVVFALLIISSCVPVGTPTELAFTPGNNRETVANRAQSLDAFQQTVYPLVRKNSCLKCHSSATLSQSPVFADTNPEVAFDAITLTNKVNLSDPDKSRVVLKLKNESHNCWSGNCLNDSAEMLDAIKRWIVLAPVDGSVGSGIVTDPLPVPLENSSSIVQTEHGTLLLQAEQEAYRLDVVSGRFFDMQDSNALDGKFLSMSAIGDNPHTQSPRVLSINRDQFNSCREFTTADSIPTTAVMKITAPRVHIPSGTTGSGGKIVNNGYRPFTTSISLQIIRPDKRLDYARMIYSGNYTNVTSTLLFNGAPTEVTRGVGTKLPSQFQGTSVSVTTTTQVLPHFVEWSDVYNNDGSFKTSGTFNRDDGTSSSLYNLFREGRYAPSADQLQRNFVKKPILKQNNFYYHYKRAISNLFYSNSTTRRSSFTYPYSQFINSDVITYFSPVVDVELRCPTAVNCSTNSGLLKFHVTQSGTPLTYSNALDCYTLNAGLTSIVPAPGLCDGSDRRYFHYIDLFVRPLIIDNSVKTAQTVSQFNSTTPSTFVDWENFTENTSLRRTYLSNQTLEELDPDVFFTGGASVVTDADDLKNFTNTFYNTIRTTRCVDCHGSTTRPDLPQFASANAGTALSVLKSGGYIKMNDPGSSLRPNGMIHQCNGASTDPRYSCDPTAEQALKNRLVAAIASWKTANDSDAAVSGATPFRSLSTAERLPGRVKYSFRVTTAGKYNVWMKIKNLADGSRINFRILNSSNQMMPYKIGANSNNAGSCYQWIASTAADIWTWTSPGRQDELASIDQRGYILLDNNKQPLNLPNNRVYFDLSVGNYTLDIIGLTEGLRLDAVGINRVENFTTDERLLFQPDRRAIDEKNISDYRRKILRYDISKQLKLSSPKKAFFEIELKKQFSGQNYVFRNPRFITSPRDFNLKFRGIKVFINGKWSFPDATYNNLEGISGDDRVLTYAPLVALTMSNDDKIHFQFDELAVTNDALTPLYPKGSLPSPVEDRRCAEVEYFMRNVKPILFEAKLMLTQDLRNFINGYPGGARQFGNPPRNYNCVTCHTATHPFFKMSTFLNNEEFCREALSRVDFQNFYQSLVIRGINGTGNHPKFVFVEKFINQADNNFKIHDQADDYLLGRYRNQSGIASELVPGPMMIWNKTDMGISSTSYGSLTDIQKAMIQRNGQFRKFAHQTISTVVESYSWYQPEIHHNLLYAPNDQLDNVLTALDVIDPDPTKGRLNLNRTQGPRIYDILTFNGNIPHASVEADGFVPFKGSLNQSFVTNGPLGFNRSTIDYISTTPATDTETQMWADYEVQRDYYREKVIQWIRLENEARLQE